MMTDRPLPPAAFGALSLVGRLLLALIFLMSGLNKFLEWETTAAYMRQQGLPAVPVLQVAAGLTELAGAVLLLLGWYARIGALLLIVFLIPTTLLFHNFWALEGGERQMQMTQFLKNLAILGGLCTVLTHGAGDWSVDGRRGAATLLK